MIGSVGGPGYEKLVSCVLPSFLTVLETDHVEDCEFFCQRRATHSLVTPRRAEKEEEEQP
jgi:hypothetical protein